jgi:hypothetical protein
MDARGEGTEEVKVCSLTSYSLITWLLGTWPTRRVPPLVEILYNVPANAGPASLDLLTKLAPRRRHCLLRASRPNKSRCSIGIMLNLDKKLGLLRGWTLLDSPITRSASPGRCQATFQSDEIVSDATLPQSLLGAGASRQLTNCPLRTPSAGWGCEMRTNLTEDVFVEWHLIDRCYWMESSTSGFRGTQVPPYQ